MMKSILVFTIVATVSVLFSGNPIGMMDNASLAHENCWQQTGIERYEYILEYRTEYDYSQVRITVDPAIRFSQMTVLTGHIPPEVYTMSSVEKLFSFVKRYSSSSTVTYDAEYGYPQEIKRELVPGEYCRIRVMEFTAR